MEKLSVVVMTYNEEDNLAKCLDSVDGLADDLLVVDSYSTDNTVPIAESRGARVISNPFAGYVEQRTFLIEKALYDFVLVLDADEWIDEQLKSSIIAVKQKREADVYEMNRCNIIGDKRIRHGSWYPDRKKRLCYRDHIRIVGENPHDRIDAKAGVNVKRIAGDIMHNSDENISTRNLTIDLHSNSAAKQMFKDGKKTNGFRIIVKPFLRFISEYFFKLGFLDGFYGFVLARSNAFYVFLREVKLKEMWRNK